MTVSELEVPGIKVRPLDIALSGHQPGAPMDTVPPLRSLLRQEVWMYWTAAVGAPSLLAALP